MPPPADRACLAALATRPAETPPLPCDCQATPRPPAPRSAAWPPPRRRAPAWGYCRIHGQLALLGIRIAPSTVWEILKTEGIDPVPQRTTVWADFLRSQAQTILAMDIIETVTLTGQHQYILAAVHHARRRVHVAGNTARTWRTPDNSLRSSS